MFNSFYQGKRVLLTGHTGFKGSWLALWLKELGAEVSGFALEPYTKNDHYCVAEIEKCLKTSTIGDIRDFKSVSKTIEAVDPEVIFHLAAQPLVRESYSAPIYNFETNVMGVVNILEAGRSGKSLKTVVNVTTDKCYENIEKNHDYKESDPLGGFDPYSASKACSEIVTSAYRRSFLEEKNVMVASARAGNVIGGGDWAKDRIMTDSFLSLGSGKEIEVRNPQATRPWQHVLEPLSGYLWLGAQRCESNWKEYVGGWNFGPETGEGHSVKEVVENVIECFESGSWKDVSSSNNPHEASLLSLDITKSKQKLSWRPNLSFEESVQMTSEWYKCFYQQNDSITEFSKKQLEEYISKAQRNELIWTREKS